jgi:hypothetical protein
MKKSTKASRLVWEHIKDFCETLTEAEDALTREMVSRIIESHFNHDSMSLKCHGEKD